RYGIVAFASSLDQASVIARSAEDLALLLQAMAGFDERDSTCVDLAVPDYRAGLEQPLDGVRIGLPREYFQDGVEPELAKVIEAAVEEYRRLGAEIKEVSLPHNALAVAAYHVIAPAEASSNLARFDGVRYGYRCENPRDLEDLYMRSWGEGFGTEVKRRLLIGTRALLAEYYQDAFLKAQKIRRLIHNDFIEAFKQVDVLLGPTTGAPAFRLGEKSADPVQMYLTDVFTIAANLAGLPALSIPAGQVDGLPVGMQLIGRHFDEARLLNLAHRFQQATDWHTVRPQNFE